MHLTSRLIRGPRLLRPPPALKHAQVACPPAIARRPFHSSSSGSSSSRSTSGQLRFALIPLFLSSPLLLDSSNEHEKPSLGTIKEAVEHPAASEFLIAEGSDAEDDRPPFLRYTIRFVSVWIWEPLRTAARFAHLAVLFLPVIITAPVMFLEYVDSGRDKRRGYKKREGERATTRWWYRLLVNQMERAGPTFIKVSLQQAYVGLRVMFNSISATARAMGWLPYRPLPRRALRTVRQATLERQTSLAKLHQEGHRPRLWQALRGDLPRVW